MLHNPVFKVLSSFFLVLALCAGQSATAPSNSSHEVERNPASSNSGISISSDLSHASEFAQQALMSGSGTVRGSLALDNMPVTQDGIEMYAKVSSYQGAGGAITATWVMINHNSYPVTIISYTDERYNQEKLTTWTYQWSPSTQTTIPAHGWLARGFGYGYGTAYYVRSIPTFDNGITVVPDHYALKQPNGIIEYLTPFSDSSSTLETNRTSAPADGITPILIKATLLTDTNTPLIDRRVTFTTTHPADVIVQPIRTTDGNGQVFAQLFSSAMGARLLHARNDTDGATLTQTVTIDFTEPLPSFDLPILYSNFTQAAQGNIGNNPGRVNSWFDHNTADQTVTTWTGNTYVGAAETGVKTCNRSSCYDGHNGIDFQNAQANEQIYAAATGSVFGVVSNCQSAPAGCTGYGNRVWINHGNGYATLYGHLASVSVANGSQITNRLAQPLGVMGNTGNSKGIHLHFGLYYDQNHNGIWTESEVVDPYGWQGVSSDPWSVPSAYLWIHPLSARQQIDASGGSATTPSGTKSAVIPPGALDSPITLEMWDMPPVSEPSAELRSNGDSLLMKVLEWLMGGSSPAIKLALPSMASISGNSFNTPVMVTIDYVPSSMPHLDIDQLTIQRWDEIGRTWTALPTTIDAVNHQASAQAAQPGHFDLQAPLICPADTLEPNDHHDGSSAVQTNGTSVNNLFDIAQDEDWFQFEAMTGRNYLLQTTDLAAGVDTILEVYDTDGAALLASNDNYGTGSASLVQWQAPGDGIYFVRVAQAAGSAFGCTSSYDININDIPVVSSIQRVDPDFTDAASVDFNVVFSEAVTDVDAEDFALAAVEIVDALVSGISGSGNAYIVSVNTGLGSGTLKLNLADNDTIKDVGGLPLGGSGGANGDFTSVDFYTIQKQAAIPYKPELLFPPRNSSINSLTPAFTWNAVANAARYEIVIATNSAFTQNIDPHFVATPAFPVTVPLTDGRYYWRVRAYNIANEPGGWSASRYFTIDTTLPAPPASTSPTNGTSLRGVPLFRWKAVSGAVLYQFQIADNPDFLNPLYTIDQRLTSRRLPGGIRGTYYWKVRARDAAGNWSDWSPVSTITILPPR
ncbi:MAG: peptidoglycan DD-metalloendopeptidase family protein [Anaerolineales bacterium]